MTTGVRLIPLQLRYEQKAFWRNPAAAFFSFAFPIVLFVLFASIFSSTRESAVSGVRGIVYYTPAILAYGVMSACFTNLAVTATFRRDQGLLKRVRGTPLTPVGYLGGLVANAVVVSLILGALIVAFGSAVYGAGAPHHWLGLVVSVLVGAASFCALGLAFTALIPNADAGPAIVNLVFFVLVVISGGFFPIASSSVLSQVASVFPLRHFIDACFASFAPHRSGSFPWGDVGIMAAWGAAGMLAAARWFGGRGRDHH
jgi:ABC-2 type transport system permease protein